MIMIGKQVTSEHMYETQVILKQAWDIHICGRGLYTMVNDITTKGLWYWEYEVVAAFGQLLFAWVSISIFEFESRPHSPNV